MCISITIKLCFSKLSTVFILSYKQDKIHVLAEKIKKNKKSTKNITSYQQCYQQLWITYWLITSYSQSLYNNIILELSYSISYPQKSN